MEIGGVITRNEAGFWDKLLNGAEDSYSYGLPIVGDAGSVFVEPFGAVAAYHTHPGNYPEIQYFSNKSNTKGDGVDAEWAAHYRKNLYMSHSYNGVIEIQRCMPNDGMCNPLFKFSLRNNEVYGVKGVKIQ